MKWRVLIRPRAEEDLREARQWYEERRKGLGDELVAAVRRAIRSLEQEPERRPLYYSEFRRLLTRRFPYKVFYLVERDRVVVFRILHVKQDYHSAADRVMTRRPSSQAVAQSSSSRSV